jgi:nucleotide-binding universal stress UspA family protein
MRILVPVDGSDCSMRAVAHVIASRAHLNPADELEIHLLNVQLSLPPEVGQFIPPGQIDRYHREDSDKALQRARQALDEAGIKHVSHAEVGHVAETIAQVAGKLACDQITMGTHGRGALADLLLGSATIRVLHLTRIPVLLVK